MLLILATLRIAGSACASPEIAISPGNRTERLDRVSYCRCEAPALRPSQFAQSGRAIGRSYGPLKLDGVSYPQTAPEDWSEAETQRGGFFDLWNFFPAALGQTKQAVLLEFELRAEHLERCYLSIGFNDCCGVLFIDREPVWGMGGAREHALGQNLVPIQLKDGHAQVSLLLWKIDPWTNVPPNHFEPEWAANLAACPSVSAAWDTYAANNYHIVDTPIVQSLEDLRFDANLPGHRSVVIRNLKGEAVLTGEVTESSGFRATADNPPPLHAPFVGTIGLGNELTEALVIEGDSTIEKITKSTVSAGRREVPDGDAWAFRCEHLIKPEFLNDRDRWWARKMALSLAMAGLRTTFDPSAEWIQQWKSAKVEFHAYKSAIDGTTQHYRSMIGPLKEGRSRPLAVFLPGAPMPVRPNLESYAVADLRETTELLTRMADQYGVDLLWPGNVDIDYGGNFTRRWIDEALQALQRDHPAVGYRPVYIIGTCAAGVAALGYAETHGGTDGIVCWSPVVSRNTYRWPIRDKDWPIALPAEALAAEATDTDLTNLKNVPLYCLFDHDVAGHGDRPGTRRLCEALARSGGSVTQHWIPYPDPALEWGLRSMDSEAEWLNWISWNAPKSGPRAPRRDQPAPQTIKDALLEGCTVETPTSEPGRAWVDRWMASVAQYRGAAIVPDRREAACHVRVRSISRDAAVSRFTAEHPGARPLRTNLRNWSDTLQAYSDIWIVELKSTPPLVVDVENCSETVHPSVPGFDLFREGECRAVAWGFRQGEWELIQVWL